MSGEPPAGSQDTPGFHTVWHAPDEGPERPVLCPHCRVEIGQIGEKGEREMFCSHCQTVYRVAGQTDGPPTLERLRGRVVIEGEGTMGQVLRGEQPDVPPWYATAAIHAALWLILLVALALFLLLAVTACGGWGGGSGFRVPGSGFRVAGARFRVAEPRIVALALLPEPGT